jgi:hypothetical protein
MRIEEEYEDLLQNIEAAIIGVFREQPGLTRHYVAEETQRYPPYTNLSERAQMVLEAAKSMCEWRLGRNHLETKEGEKIAGPCNSLSEIIACLKRIRKSVQFWTKEGGRQGYLKYVSQFV